MSGCFDIRADLIRDATIDTEEIYECKYMPCKLTSGYISWLFKHCNVKEFNTEYYDSENAEDRLVEMSWASSEIPQSSLTQKERDRIAKNLLDAIRKTNIKKERRIYKAETDEFIFIYCYFRDWLMADYYITFVKGSKK